MNKKTITIILSLVLLIAFFLPYVSNGPVKFSCFDIVFGKDGVEGLSSHGKFLFVTLLIPIGAILILLGVFTKDIFANSGFVYWLPLIGIIYIVIMLYVTGSSALTVSELVGWLGYGFWVSLAASIMLPFSRNTA